MLYFDPGLGAMIAQAAIAAFAGFVLFYKTIIAVVKSWLGMTPKAESDDFDDAYDAKGDQEEKP